MLTPFRSSEYNNDFSPNLRDVTTALNAQKDRINELGSVHFAAETGQTLTDFYSINKFGSPPDAAEKRSRGRKSKATGKHVST